MFSEWLNGKNFKSSKTGFSLVFIIAFLIHLLIFGSMIVIPLMTANGPDIERQIIIRSPLPDPVLPPPVGNSSEQNENSTTESKDEEKTVKKKSMIVPIDVPEKIENESILELFEEMDKVNKVGYKYGVELDLENRTDTVFQKLFQLRKQDKKEEKTPVNVIRAPKILSRVSPVYPKAAKVAKIEGKVILNCIIDTKGKVKEVNALSGHLLLQKAAIDAVKQWSFEPMIFNGIPREVKFQLTVIFQLTGK